MITHIHFQESVGWLGGAGQGHQTNTATLIYCFTAQWNHCFDDYCARRPHYDEQMLPQYSTVLRQDQTFRRLLIQTSVPWVRANFLRNLVHRSFTFPVECIIGAKMEHIKSGMRTVGHSVFRAHISNFFCCMRVCNLFTTAIVLSLVSAASAPSPTKTT